MSPIFSKPTDSWRSLPKLRIALILGLSALGAWGLYGVHSISGRGEASQVAESFGGKAVSEKRPVVAITEKPVLTDKILRLAYDASDDQGVAEVALRVTSQDPQPGANNAPVEITLPVPAAKQISRTDYFQDLAERQWAGQPVTIQVVATNQSGKRSVSNPVDVTMPEKRFLHPVARMLIEERKKLMKSPDDEALQEEAANIMASVAQQTANYKGDPVVFMALRSGAVRLVLGHNKDAAISVNDLLWQTASRIENGGSASQKTSRNSQRNLSDH